MQALISAATTISAAALSPCIVVINFSRSFNTLTIAMLLTALESTLNRNIAASSTARSLCARLAGKSLRLQLTGLPVEILLCAEAERIQLSTNAVLAADATLSGSPIGLLTLAQQTSTASLSGTSVRITGDAEVVQAFSQRDGSVPLEISTVVTSLLPATLTLSITMVMVHY